jgi:hypothetical protein
MKSAVDLLICCFPSLYFQGCVAHFLGLLLENWGKTTSTKQIVEKVKDVVFFHMTTPCVASNLSLL